MFLVRPIRVDGPELPSVVKIGPAASIEQEWQAYQTCIKFCLPSSAGIQEAPVYPNRTTLGGIRYQQIGEGTFTVESCADYYHHASIEDVEFVLTRLFAGLSAILKRIRLQPELYMRQAYDSILPVNLVVEWVQGPPSISCRDMNPASCGQMGIAVGDDVSLIGFRVTEIDLSKQRLQMDTPELAPAFRFYLTGVSALTSYHIGQIISDPIYGRIQQTRQVFLREKAQAILSPQQNLADDWIPFVDGTLLPNPLAALEPVLGQSFDAYIACIHGDLHLDNILVEVNGRHPYLIDFARSRPDHVLRDFFHLEMSILTNLVPYALQTSGQGMKPLLDFYTRVHCALTHSVPVTPPDGLEKPFAMLVKVRKAAQPHLVHHEQWHEYHTGLFLYLLSALKFDSLDKHPLAPLPKQLAFWGAAIIHWLSKNMESICTDLIQQIQTPSTGMQPYQHDASTRPKEQSILLNRVMVFWIDGVLEESLHNAVFLELGKRLILTNSNSIVNMWVTRNQVMQIITSNGMGYDFT